MAGAILALWTSPAGADFPGKNGRIAFTAYHDFTEHCPPGSSTEATATGEGTFTIDPDGSDTSHQRIVTSDPSPFGVTDPSELVVADPS